MCLYCYSIYYQFTFSIMILFLMLIKNGGWKNSQREKVLYFY